MNILFRTLIIIFGAAFISVTGGCGAHINNSVVFQVDHSQIVFDSSTVESAIISASEKDSYGINIKLRTIAANNFGDITQKNIGKQANIILNGKVVSSSTIQSRIGGEFLINGLTKEQADEFIKSLYALVST